MELMMGTHVSADDLRIPGMGHTLRQAGNQLQDLSERLDGLAHEIRHTRPDPDERGYATRALRSLARRTAEALQGDSEQMHKLAEAVSAEADLLVDSQGNNMEQLRQQWRQAKQHLIEVAETQARKGKHFLESADIGGGNGHGGRVLHAEAALADLNGHALARRIEAGVVTDYSHLWRRMFGYTPAPYDGPQQKFLVQEDSELDAAISNFRQTVRTVMEDWAGAVRRLDDLDQTVQHRLRRKPVLVAKEANGGDGPDQTLVSGPAALKALGRELADKARGIGGLIDAVQAIAPDLARGRMQPEEDRGARNNQEFEQSWADHLRDLRQNFGPVADEAERIAEEMMSVDQQGARAIRALIRDDD